MEVQSRAIFEKEKILQKKEHAEIAKQLGILTHKMNIIDVTNSRIENDVKEINILTKNTAFSRKLMNNLESHLSFISENLEKNKKEILRTALYQAFKVFNYILDADFSGIEKEIIYKKLEYAAKFTKNTMNIPVSDFVKIEKQIKAVFRAFSAKVEAISVIETNGQRRVSFEQMTLLLIDDVVSIFN